MKNKPIKAAVTVFLFIFILSGCDFMHEFPFSKAPLPFDGDICFTMKLSKFKEKYGEPTETDRIPYHQRCGGDRRSFCSFKLGYLHLRARNVREEGNR